MQSVPKQKVIVIKSNLKKQKHVFYFRLHHEIATDIVSYNITRSMFRIWGQDLLREIVGKVEVRGVDANVVLALDPEDVGDASFGSRG